MEAFIGAGTVIWLASRTFQISRKKERALQTSIYLELYLFIMSDSSQEILQRTELNRQLTQAALHSLKSANSKSWEYYSKMKYCKWQSKPP